MNEVGHLHLNWFGGEPLLRLNEMEKIAGFLKAEASSRGKTVSQFITSNGYLLTRGKVRRLKEMGVENIQISIDGGSETHNVSRGHRSGKATYARVLQACRYVVETDIELMIRVNLTRENSGNVRPLLDDLRDAGITPRNSVLHVVRAVNHGNLSAEEGNKYFTLREFAEEWTRIIGLTMEYGYSPPPISPRSYNCGFDLMHTHMIGIDGNLYHCSSSNALLAELGEDGVQKNTALYQVVKERRSFQNNECRGCFCLPLCMGGCSYLEESGQEKCNPELYGLEKLVRLTIDHWKGKEGAASKKC